MSEEIKNFTGDHPGVPHLNQVVGGVNRTTNVTGDPYIRVSRVANGWALGLNWAMILTKIPQLISAPSNVHWAYCGMAPTTGNSLPCTIDSDTNNTADLVDVYFTIIGSAATHNLNASTLQDLEDGTCIPVAKRPDGKWWFLGIALDSQDCA